LPTAGPLLALFDVPQERERRVEHAREVLAERASTGRPDHQQIVATRSGRRLVSADFCEYPTSGNSRQLIPSVWTAKPSPALECDDLGGTKGATRHRPLLPESRKCAGHRGLVTGALKPVAIILPAVRALALFNVPQKRERRVEHAREVLAERASADKLPGRNIGNEFERALLNPISEIAPLRIV
jgi:hypothetical protein